MAASPQIAHARACGSAEERASALAALQFGAIARRQLLDVGFTRSRVEHWIRSKRLHPHHPGVYAYGRSELGTDGELAAALLLAGPVLRWGA